MKSSVGLLFASLFGVIILVWALFYLSISQNIYDNTQKHLDTTAQQIVYDLGAEFDNLERVSYTLSRLEDVKRFATTDSIEDRFALAQRISDFLYSSSYNPSFTGNVIIYGEDASFYRFAGKLSNTSCSYLGNLLGKTPLPDHISTQLEGEKYIGYGIGIPSSGNDGDNNEQVGAIVMLIEEEKLHELFYNYAPDDSLYIAVAAGGKVIAANSDTPQDSLTLVRKHVGITPFEIIITANERYLNASTYYFTIATAITIASFLAVLFVFARVQNKRFFGPMLSIMRNVESIETYNSQSPLPKTHSEDFNLLVDRLNDMLCRLDKKNEEVIRSEIEKQQAIIVSLKKQINAHFTINTLSTIKILVEQSELENAGHVIEDLSDMIRYAYDKDEYINVWDELSLLEKYVAIMNIRYNNKIELRFDVDDRLMDVVMPRMLLQPIVENAIMHGFKHMETGCVIDVRAEHRGDRMHITVTDNGTGMDASAVVSLQERINAPEYSSEGIDNIALVNIKNRLLSQYGDGFSFEIHSGVGTGSRVIIELPVLLIRPPSL